MKEIKDDLKKWIYVPSSWNGGSNQNENSKSKDGNYHLIKKNNSFLIKFQQIVCKFK